MWNVLFCDPGFHYTRDYYYFFLYFKYIAEVQIQRNYYKTFAVPVRSCTVERENKRQRQSKSRNEGKNVEQWLRNKRREIWLNNG